MSRQDLVPCLSSGNCAKPACHHLRARDTGQRDVSRRMSGRGRTALGRLARVTLIAISPFEDVQGVAQSWASTGQLKLMAYSTRLMKLDEIGIYDWLDLDF